MTEKENVLASARVVEPTRHDVREDVQQAQLVRRREPRQQPKEKQIDMSGAWHGKAWDAGVGLA